MLIGYPLLMMFSLAYAGEHYVADGIAGALCACLVSWLATRAERWWDRRRDEEEPPSTGQDAVEEPAPSPAG